MKTFLEHTTYAIINFAEACVTLLTLGYYNPTWSINYLYWMGKRKADKRRMENLK